MTTKSKIVDECRVFADQLADKGINLRILIDIIGIDMTGLSPGYIIESGNFYTELAILWKAVCLKEILVLKDK